MASIEDHTSHQEKYNVAEYEMSCTWESLLELPGADRSHSSGPHGEHAKCVALGKMGYSAAIETNHSTLDDTIEDGPLRAIRRVW